jgi:hypothetical protein
VASFLLTEWLMHGHPSAAFYQMPARYWELAAGGLIAVMPSRQMPTWTAWAGLALTVAACFVRLPHFPGLGALPAVAGAALLIAAIHNGATNSILASRSFVGVGLISYSLYLWHWPLLSLDRMLRAGVAPLDVRLGLVAAAFVLAIASYRYVETPLRRPWATSRRTVAAGFAMMAVLSCGAMAWLQSVPPPLVAKAVFTVKCHPYVEGQIPQMQRPDCLGKEAKVLTWGDSYAVAWHPMAEAIGAQLHMPITSLALDGCPSLVGANLVMGWPEYATMCPASNAKAVAYLKANGADTVIITNRWEHWITTDPTNGAGLALDKSIADISPYVRRILIIAPTPVLAERPDKCAALHLDCSVSRKSFEAAAAPAWEAIHRAENNPKVTVTDPADWFCGNERCDAFRDGAPLYRDGHHVDQTTATLYAAKVAKAWR